MEDKAQSFDFVIIGGGTAGLALACRLSEIAHISVAVLEAGKDSTQSPIVSVPGLRTKAVGHPDLDWGYKTTQQEHANNRTIAVPRGKGLGGTSTINYMILSRASSTEYDGIEALGNDGWDWNGLLPYFKKSETLSVNAQSSSEYGVSPSRDSHGTDGPLLKTLPRWHCGLQFPFNNTLETFQVPRNADPNNGTNLGIATHFAGIHPQTSSRVSSATAYYKPIQERRNLFIFTESQASRIVFDGGDNEQSLKRATNVEYIKDGKIHTVVVEKEVILSAGVYGSPHLLELSGIGDPDILARNKIRITVSNPNVGENLRDHHRQDHIWAPVIFEAKDDLELIDKVRDPAFAQSAMQEYTTTKSGLLASTLNAWSNVPLSSAMDEANRTALKEKSLLADKGNKKIRDLQMKWLLSDEVPQIQLCMASLLYPGAGVTPEPGKRYATIITGLTHPQSLGSVHIQSDQCQDSPAINHRYLSNAVDVDLMVAAVQFSRRLAKTAPLSDHLVEEVAPGAECQTHQDIEKFVRRTISTIFHPIGTCGMLPEMDGGVVDSKLHVYGLANVRVVDASIIPIQLSGHPQAMVYAIAEMAASIIKSSHNLSD